MRWCLASLNWLFGSLLFGPLMATSLCLAMGVRFLKMPTRFLHFLKNDSQSASKPKGHFKALNHGVLAFLARHHGQSFTLPVCAPIVAGNKEILEWQGLERNTQPAQMARDALKVIDQVKRSILLVLDRFYLSKARSYL